MIKKRKILKISIDSPAAAGAGTQAKLISKHYNLLHLDTGRVYRYVANIKITEPLKYNYRYIKKRIDKLKIKDLQNKKLLSDKVATVASIIAKDNKVRNILKNFQVKFSIKNKNCCIEGRDISTKILPNSDVKFFFVCNINIAAKRTTKRAKGRKAPVPTPRITIAIRDTKEPIIKTSPCAKLIIPIMP